MKTLKLVLLVLVGIVLLLLVVQNTVLIPAHFLWITADVPAILLLILTTVGGFAMGLLVALFIQNSKNQISEGERHE